MHRLSNTVTRYANELTAAWDRLSDHHALDTDRARGLLDLQGRLERLDVRLIADPTDDDAARQLEVLFDTIDGAIDDVNAALDPDDDTALFA